MGQKIIDNAQYIIDAADIYGVDPNVVAGVIYAENSLNVDFKDTLTDWLGFYGVNSLPGANPFGKYVGDNYDTMEYLLKQK